MLPANLAKTRAAGRGTYGELLMLNPGAGPVTSGTPASAYRYTPYPLPVSAAAAVPVATGLTAAAMLPIAVAAPTATGSSLLHYAPAPALYDVTGAVQAAASCKRVYATAAALRPMHSRPANTLTYSMNDLLGIQGLDLSSIYPNHAMPALGL